MPRKVFTAGEVLAAADVNSFLMNQAVMTFAGSAARSSAIGTATEGMLTYLADTDTFQFWNGTAYAPLTPATPTLEYVVVAGGGGGSLRAAGVAAGGGGAGGYRTNVVGALSGGSTVAELPLPIVAGTYGITVGAGGNKITIDNEAGTSGSYSLFINVLCIGGAFGSTFNRGATQGGSGGGGWQGAPTGTSGVLQQGFKGGNANGGLSGGAGGGGAGATGATVTGVNGSAGGDGLANSITGTSVTRAGGGGGGGSTGSGGAGGAGGGGAGSIDGNAAGNGTVNTGGGGGGGEQAGGGSGAGGSGIVIFSVPTGTGVSFSAGVTQTNATVGSRRVYTVTATSTTSETVTIS